jgi:hypothetical protein
MKSIIILFSLFNISCATTQQFDIIVPKASIEEHWKRVGWTLQCKWKPEYQYDRKSEYKGCFFEFTHATKNVVVEWLRKNRIWNRGNRDPSKIDWYFWPDA